MSQDFTLASEQVISRPDAANPMAVNVAVEIFNEEITGQTSDANYDSVRVFVKYHSFVPDTSVQADDTVPAAPYKFGLIAVVEQRQQDGINWEEIGRQNNSLSEVQSGKEREILITPLPVATEEGIDTEIQGFNNVIIRKKSAWQDTASGALRVRIIAMQGDQPNSPFVSAVVSVSGTRYDAVAA